MAMESLLGTASEAALSSIMVRALVHRHRLSGSSKRTPPMQGNSRATWRRNYDARSHQRDAELGQAAYQAMMGLGNAHVADGRAVADGGWAAAEHDGGPRITRRGARAAAQSSLRPSACARLTRIGLYNVKSSLKI